MNEDLQRKLAKIENLILIQRDCISGSLPQIDYMHGMLNGLICAHSIFVQEQPKYHTISRNRKKTQIRHKNGKRRRR